MKSRHLGEPAIPALTVVLAAATLAWAAPTQAATTTATPSTAATSPTETAGKGAKADGAKAEGAKAEGAKAEGAKADGAKADKVMIQRRGVPSSHGSRSVTSKSDSAYTLRGGQEGTAFQSLTIEGEDAIQIEFDRPPLDLDLDPQSAPGLEWGSARDVLDRTVPDLVSPFVALSAHQPSPYLGRPWLDGFTSGAVARFRPQVRNVERWKLMVADSKGQAVAGFQGKGEPPKEISWDGRSRNGDPVVPGLTYSYVFEAYDRAGNKRNFVGEGFRLSAYRLDGADNPVLVFSGRDLVANETGGWSATSSAAPRSTPALLLETASWLNQSSRMKQGIRVSATARSFEQAQSLAASITRSLTPHLLGDPARVQAVTAVEPDAPVDGTVRIAFVP